MDDGRKLRRSKRAGSDLLGGANVYYDKLQESSDQGFPEVEFETAAAS